MHSLTKSVQAQYAENYKPDKIIKMNYINGERLCIHKVDGSLWLRSQFFLIESSSSH